MNIHHFFRQAAQAFETGRPPAAGGAGGTRHPNRVRRRIAGRPRGRIHAAGIAQGGPQPRRAAGTKPRPRCLLLNGLACRGGATCRRACGRGAALADGARIGRRRRRGDGRDSVVGIPPFVHITGKRLVDLFTAVYAFPHSSHRFFAQCIDLTC